MQSYIVRVYRRHPDNKEEVAGIIEKVGTQHKYSFQDLSGLSEYLEHFIKSDDSDYSATESIDACIHDGIFLNS